MEYASVLKLLKQPQRPVTLTFEESSKGDDELVAVVALRTRVAELEGRLAGPAAGAAAAGAAATTAGAAAAGAAACEISHAGAEACRRAWRDEQEAEEEQEGVRPLCRVAAERTVARAVHADLLLLVIILLLRIFPVALAIRRYKQRWDCAVDAGDAAAGAVDRNGADCR